MANHKKPPHLKSFPKNISATPVSDIDANLLQREWGCANHSEVIRRALRMCAAPYKSDRLAKVPIGDAAKEAMLGDLYRRLRAVEAGSFELVDIVRETLSRCSNGAEVVDALRSLLASRPDPELRSFTTSVSKKLSTVGVTDV